MRLIATTPADANGWIESRSMPLGDASALRSGAAAQTGVFKSPSGGAAARGAERRRYDRYAVRCECWIESEDTTVHGQAADLGLGGVFLRTAVPVASGQHVDVMLVFGHDAQRVCAHGVVTRIVPAERGRRYGVGIELVDIFEGAEALKRLGIASL